ncbi:hypothetical protein Tco_0086202 [Tanacetum coccineum]
MRTRSQTRNCNRQQQAQPAVVEPFHLEEPVVNPPLVPMADNRTMAQLLQAPTEGYEDAIVIPEINAYFDNAKVFHKIDFENYVKANDAVLRNMQNQGQEDISKHSSSILLDIVNSSPSSAETLSSQSIVSTSFQQQSELSWLYSFWTKLPALNGFDVPLPASLHECLDMASNSLRTEARGPFVYGLAVFMPVKLVNDVAFVGGG